MGEEQNVAPFQRLSDCPVLHQLLVSESLVSRRFLVHCVNPGRHQSSCPCDYLGNYAFEVLNRIFHNCDTRSRWLHQFTQSICKFRQNVIFLLCTMCFWVLNLIFGSFFLFRFILSVLLVTSVLNRLLWHGSILCHCVDNSFLNEPQREHF